MKKLFCIFLIFSVFSFLWAGNLSEYKIKNNSYLENNAISINCDYDFFWNKFINPYDASSKPDLIVTMPSSWNKYDLAPEASEIAKKGSGAGSYRILVSNLKPETEYSFLPYGMIYTAGKFYCNGDLFLRSGVPNLHIEKTIADQKMTPATFKSDKNGNALLIFHISNKFYRKGGFRSAIKIQEAAGYTNRFYKDLSKYCILCGILFIICFYSFLLSILKKDKTNLFLGLFVLSILSRIVSQSFPLIKFFFDAFPYTILLRVEYISVFLSPSLYTLYINELNKDVYKHLPANYLAFPAYIFLVLDFTTPIYITNRLVPLMQIYLFLVITINLVLIFINVIRHKNFISLIAILTLIIIGFGAASDILLLNYISFIGSTSSLTTSFVIYAFAQIILVAYLQNRELINVQELNINLEETNKAYYRFVPREFLDLFNKKDITEVQLGEYIASNMAILSADIRNFTSISEKMTEIQVFDMLNSYFKQIAPIIRKYNGIIEKYLGDGIIALFPESAESALNCAIEMQEEMINLRNDFKEKDLPEIKIGIGIHYGKVIIGTGGDDKRMTEFALSNDIDTAIKTEASTKVFQRPIVVTKQALEAAAEEARNYNRKFDFYGKNVSFNNTGDLFYIYSEKSGVDL